MFYTELTFHISPYVEDIADAIIAELGDLGYDSFSYSDDGFKAYIPSKNFNEEQVKSLEILSFFQSLYTITWEKAEIENQDWNKIWEENFTPILVQDRILVRAGFHPTIENIEHEIIIDPKRCPETAREFSSYEYESDGRGGWRAAFPDRDNHAIDAVRYSREEDMRHIRVR